MSYFIKEVSKRIAQLQEIADGHLNLLATRGDGVWVRNDGGAHGTISHDGSIDSEISKEEAAMILFSCREPV